MTRDDIIRLARGAGVARHGLGWTCWEGQLERFAALVAAAEREECAREADYYAQHSINARTIAAAIRARKDET